MTQEQFKDETRRLRPRLMELARRYLGDDDAEDTVQDTLLRLWQMVGDLRQPLDGLALRLTRNLCIDQLRRQRPASPPASYDSFIVIDDAYANNDEERIERMMSVIATLPSLQQTILRLRHLEGMEMKEIAALAGSSETAIRTALSRARKAVRTQYLKQYE